MLNAKGGGAAAETAVPETAVPETEVTMLYKKGRLCVNAVSMMPPEKIIALLEDPVTNVTIEGYSVLLIAMLLKRIDVKKAVEKYFLENPDRVEDLLIPSLYTMAQNPAHHLLHDAEDRQVSCIISGEPIQAHECVFIWGKSGYQILSLNSFMLWMNTGKYNCPMTREKVTHISFPSDLSGLFHPHEGGGCIPLDREGIIKSRIAKRTIADVLTKRGNQKIWQPDISGFSVFHAIMSTRFSEVTEKYPQIIESATSAAIAPIFRKNGSGILFELFDNPDFFRKMITKCPGILHLIKPEDLYEISHSEHNPGASPFFSLCVNISDGRLEIYKALLNHNPDFYTMLTTSVLHQPLLQEGNDYRYMTPFHLLSCKIHKGECRGIALLDSLMTCQPKLLNIRACEALFVQIPEGAGKGDFPLRTLSMFDSGIKLIRKMFENHRGVLSRMTSNMLCAPISNHLKTKDVTPLILRWIKRPVGAKMLAEFIIDNSEFAAMITPEVMNHPQTEGFMRNFTLLLGLVFHPVRVEVLYIILQRAPSFAQKITAEGLTDNTHPQHMPPLHCLARNGIGLRCLELLFQLNPSIAAGITPEILTAEIPRKSLEGTVSAKKLLDRTQPGRELLEVINQARKEAMFPHKPAEGSARPRRGSF